LRNARLSLLQKPDEVMLEFRFMLETPKGELS
jgi:hypothetical protein